MTDNRFSTHNILKGIGLSSLIFFTVLANSLVLVVLLVKERRLLRKPLYIFICNICVTDLFASLFTMTFEVSEELTHHWLYGEVACKIIEYLEMSLFGVNIFTHLSIAIERYRNVVHPLKPSMKLQTVKRLLVVSWCYPSFMSLPYLYSFRLHKIDGDDICMAVSMPWIWLDKLYASIELFSVFLIPLVILLWMYVIILKCLYRRQQQSNDVGAAQRATVRAAATYGSRVSVAVVCVFVVCWLPFIVMYITRVITSPEQVNRTSSLYITALYFLFASELLSPVIYCAFDRNIRPRLFRILRCPFRHNAVGDASQSEAFPNDSSRYETNENRTEHGIHNSAQRENLRDH